MTSWFFRLHSLMVEWWMPSNLVIVASWHVVCRKMPACPSWPQVSIIIILMSRNNQSQIALLTGDRSLVDVVVHELTHSWFGNGVTYVIWLHILALCSCELDMLIHPIFGWMKGGQRILKEFCKKGYIHLLTAAFRMWLDPRLCMILWSNIRTSPSISDWSLPSKKEKIQMRHTAVCHMRKALTSFFILVSENCVKFLENNKCF